MLTSDEILEQAARDGSIDISEWPRVLENILQKLHDIVHNEFPTPKAPPPPNPPVLIPAAPVILPSNDDSARPQKSPEPTLSTAEPSEPVAATDKENTVPRPPVPSFAAIPQIRQQSPSSPLPPELYTLYNYSRTTLENNFPKNPPYTIQRLAELVLQPRRYYRYLPPFLQALDRVVSVTSTVNEFPLAHASIDSASSFLANGEPSENHSEREGLGSDESLGGALLTPIPWLKRENGHHDFRSESSQTIEGPNGVGVIETVSVSNGGAALPQEEDTMSHEQHLRAEGGVTQGELLRQEQEAGIVPVGQEVPRRTLMASGSANAVGRGESTLAAEEEAGEKPEEHAHARGPEEIGAEDMGPQPEASIGVTRPLNMEAAAGRAKSPEVSRDDKDTEGDTAIEGLAQVEEDKKAGPEEERPDEKVEQVDEEMPDA
ncbi:hypothetical protein E4T50_02866 [Aureobasidium sp. EXF-12298]|nr:hypothetical protein E4T50_02866 [Aureobasidium sp. EXF-12298]KAI4764969.1 hypothetical protein E4T51_02026 [Aureobasidium sp. EXF-12344]KAI4782940.1 hypothetical protein E4T52_02081 [Aureobasidium sp. EXF-3400]